MVTIQPHKPNTPAYVLPLMYLTMLLYRLQKLNHGVQNRVFEHKTPAQAIAEVLEKYNIQAECDSFGPERNYREGMQRTDWELVRGLAKQYGRDIAAFGNTVYVKETMTQHKNEAIYEWGKSLIDFRVRESIARQTSHVQVINWDVRNNKEIRVKKAVGDISQKIGGKKDWTQVSKGGEGKWVDTVFEHSAQDVKQAEELALSRLREQSMEYIRAEGSGEGNAELRAGMMVTVKNVGTAHGGEYIADAVIHDFSLYTGYITEFHLKRNMLNDEFKPGTASSGGVASGSGKGGAAAEDQADDEGEEDEDGPEYRSLIWKKDGREISEALVDDEVTLFCEVKNIDDGETVKFNIYEEGKNKYDNVDELEGEVINGRVEAPWKVIYKADEGSSVADELEEQGWTIPDYRFYAKYGEVESGESKVLEVKGWEKIITKNEETGEVRANKKYTLFLSDGSTRKGETDAEGVIYERKLPDGFRHILFEE